MSLFKNISPKLIRSVEDRLEEVHRALHTGQPVSDAESLPLRLEEQELVRTLENLYEDRSPQFKGGKGYEGNNIGKYIDPHEE